MATQQQYYNQLASVYDPQVKLIKQQQAQLNSQFQGQLSGLEQAKLNAFRDVASRARGMGVAFGGYSPSEQMRYVGEKYLPAYANIQNNKQNQSFSLMSALNDLYGKRRTTAMDMFNSEQNSIRAAQAKIQAAQIAAASRAARSYGGGSSGTSDEAKYWKMLNSGKIGGRLIATKGEELKDPNKYVSRESFIKALGLQFSQYDPRSIAKEVYSIYRG